MSTKLAMREVTEAFTSAAYRTPKTVLGYFAIVTGILCVSGATVIGIFSREPELHRLIVPSLVFCGAIVLLVLVGVFVTAWKDPTILMLGQVSGEVYIQNRKLLMGDSAAGEHTERVIGTGQGRLVGGGAEDIGSEDAG